MNRYNKYLALFLLVVISSVFVAHAQDSAQTTSAEVNTAVETRADLQKLRENQEALRKERLQQEEELRKQRNEEVLKMRLDAKAKVESGELKPAEAFKELNANAKEQREEARMEIQKVRDDFKVEIKEGRQDILTLLRNKKDSIISAVQEKRDSFKEEFEAKKEEMQAKRAEIKASFQANLLKIKDENKRARVENITDNFVELNVKFTTKASAIVDQIETVLVAIESRTDKAEANGANVSGVRTLIVSAETAIADARAAIAIQVAKVYTPNVQSDANAQSSLSSVNNTFKADIKAMNAKIKTAHESTRKAAAALKTIPNVDAEVSASVEVTN